MAELFIYSRRCRNVCKRSLAVVMEEAISRRFENAWCAVISRGGCRVAVRTVRRGKVGVVDYHQIEPAVAVIIEERSACSPTLIVGSAFFRDVNKLSVTFIQIHLIRTEVREI